MGQFKLVNELAKCVILASLDDLFGRYFLSSIIIYGCMSLEEIMFVYECNFA